MQRDNYLNVFQQKLQHHRILALLGPRQCGKTTLAKEFAYSQPAFPKRNYFDLENPTDLERLRDPYQSLKDLDGLIVIDEIQRAPEIFPVLRVLHDEFSNKQFLVLGSASKQLIGQSSESLTGRIHYEEITPFGFFETNEWKKLWFRGGFPRSYLVDDVEASCEWRQNYITTLLEQDVPNLGFRIPAQHLRRFWMMLAHCHGQIFNAHTIAQSIDLSQQSARRYLDLLHDMLMVRVLQPWHENIGKRQIKMPKSYIRDSGLFHTLMHIDGQDAFEVSPYRGASFEGFVIEEIIKTLRLKYHECFFWRTHTGAELDLLVLVQGKKIGFEVKMTSNPSLTRSMHVAKVDLNLDHLYVVYPGEVTWRLNDWATALVFEDIVSLKDKFKSM